MGDFNAKIGVAKKEEYLVSKQFGFGNRNEKGYRLVHFALEHNLTLIIHVLKRNHGLYFIKPA